MFLTGQEEIEAMSKTCRDIAKHLPDGCPSMLVLPLYASLPYTQQLRVFQGAPKVSAPRLLPRPVPGYPDGCTSGACAPVSGLQIRCVDRVPRYLSRAGKTQACNAGLQTWFSHGRNRETVVWG